VITTSVTKFSLFLGLILVLGFLSIPTKERMGQYYFNSYRFDEAVDAIEGQKGKLSIKSLQLMKEYYLNEDEVQKAIEAQLQILKRVPRNINQIKELVKLYEWEAMYEEALKWKVKHALLLKGQEKQDLLIDIMLSYQIERNFKEADAIAEMLKQFKNQKAYRSILNYYSSTDNLLGALHATVELRDMGLNLESRNELNIAAIYAANGEIEKSTKTYLSLLTEDESLYGDEDWLKKLTPKTIANEKSTIERVLKNYEQEGNLHLVAMSKLYLYENAGHDIQDALSALSLSKDISHDFKARVLKALQHETKAQNNAYIGYLLANANDLENAILYFEKAHAAAPKNKDYYSDLTYLYEKTGRIEEAYKMQKKLLQLIEGPKAKVNYISADELLYAQNGVSAARPTNEVQRTKRKIIELLITLKKEEDLHDALIDYCLAYPMDLDIQKELATSYLKRSQTIEAAKVYKYINSVSPYDTESVLFLIDQDIENKNFIEASKFLEAHREYIPENEYNRRAISIYYEIEPQKLDSLCKYSPLEEESLIQCHLYRKEYKEVMALLKKSNRDGDKITLAYLLLDMKKTNEANIEIQKLEKLSPLYVKEVKQLKKYLNEIVSIQEYQRSKDINGQAVIFNSPGYSFLSADIIFTTPLSIPWRVGAQAYEQSYKGTSISNIAPLVEYRNNNKSIQYRYGLIQNSHEAIGQLLLTEKSSLSTSASVNTPFTDLYTVSFNKEIKRKNFILNYNFTHENHQFDSSYNFSSYNFEDNSYPSASRQTMNAQYLYQHQNEVIQGISLADINFSSSRIAGVDFVPITLLSYKLGYRIKKDNFFLTPALTTGMNLRDSDGPGSIYTYEATASYQFSLEKYVRLYWEQRNIGQQNVSQKNTTFILNFNYWYY
jgi:tetratricopeptide (TPR) repeat protein